MASQDAMDSAFDRFLLPSTRPKSRISFVTGGVSLASSNDTILLSSVRAALGLLPGVDDDMKDEVEGLLEAAVSSSSEQESDDGAARDRRRTVTREHFKQAVAMFLPQEQQAQAPAASAAPIEIDSDSPASAPIEEASEEDDNDSIVLPTTSEDESDVSDYLDDEDVAARVGKKSAKSQGKAKAVPKTRAASSKGKAPAGRVTRSTRSTAAASGAGGFIVDADDEDDDDIEMEEAPIPAAAARAAPAGAGGGGFMPSGGGGGGFFPEPDSGGSGSGSDQEAAYAMDADSEEDDESEEWSSDGITGQGGKKRGRGAKGGKGAGRQARRLTPTPSEIEEYRDTFDLFFPASAGASSGGSAKKRGKQKASEEKTIGMTELKEVARSVLKEEKISEKDLVEMLEYAGKSKGMQVDLPSFARICRELGL